MSIQGNWARGEGHPGEVTWRPVSSGGVVLRGRRLNWIMRDGIRLVWPPSQGGSRDEERRGSWILQSRRDWGRWGDESHLLLIYACMYEGPAHALGVKASWINPFPLPCVNDSELACFLGGRGVRRCQHSPVWALPAPGWRPRSRGWSQQLRGPAAAAGGSQAAARRWRGRGRRSTWWRCQGTRWRGRSKSGASGRAGNATRRRRSSERPDLRMRSP